MEGKLKLCVLMLHLQVSLAVWQRIKVMKGGTLNLHCPIKKQDHHHHVEWKAPDGNIMFFNMIQAHRDKRVSLLKLSESEYSISISNVTFSDGGTFTCSHYLLHTVEKTVEVTVLDRPRMDVTTHKGSTVIKCTAEGNYPSPEISWQFRNGLEFHYDHAQIIQEDKKYVTTELLYIKPAKKASFVKCIVRHPALGSKTLLNFVRITPPTSQKHLPKTTVSLPETTKLPTPANTGELTTHLFPTQEKTLATEFSTAIPQFSTGVKNPTKTTNSLLKATTKQKTLPTTGELTSDHFPTTEKEVLTTEFSTTISPFSTDDEETTGFPINPSQFNSSEISTVNSTTERSGILNTTGNWLTSAGSPANISFNETKKDSTESGNELEKQKGNEGNVFLLVFLITCLLLGLLVVVIFIGIKLRRAHIIWKRENDDTDNSESSNKSKSSQEDKNIQRRRGFFNTGLTQYVIQEPTVITSVTNPAAMTSPENMAHEQNPHTQLPPPQATPKSDIKETEL